LRERFTIVTATPVPPLIYPMPVNPAAAVARVAADEVEIPKMDTQPFATRALKAGAAAPIVAMALAIPAIIEVTIVKMLRAASSGPILQTHKSLVSLTMLRYDPILT
jgi:hypothetical protein